MSASSCCCLSVLKGKEETYTKNREEDVDAEVSAATTLEEDSEGREDDRNDDLADVAKGMPTC